MAYELNEKNLLGKIRRRTKRLDRLRKKRDVLDLKIKNIEKIIENYRHIQKVFKMRNERAGNLSSR